jgi:hypothetical protein
VNRRSPTGSPAPRGVGFRLRRLIARAVFFEDCGNRVPEVHWSGPSAGTHPVRGMTRDSMPMTDTGIPAMCASNTTEVSASAMSAHRSSTGWSWSTTERMTVCIRSRRIPCSDPAKMFAILPQRLQSGNGRSAAVAISSPRSTLLACSIASAFRGAPALVDVRRLFLHRRRRRHRAFQIHERADQLVDAVSVGVAPCLFRPSRNRPNTLNTWM